MQAFVVSLIRQSPERYIVFFEAVMQSDPMIVQHINDDWDCSLVYDTHDKTGKPYLWCLRHEVTQLNACDCIDSVLDFRDDVKLTDNKD
jgi:hypothetical protein